LKYPVFKAFFVFFSSVDEQLILIIGSKFAQNFTSMTKLYFSFITTTLLSLISSNPIYAQPKKGEFIHASLGIGLVAAQDESEAYGSGFYAQAEYVLSPYSWLGVRPYIGLVAASGETEEGETEQYSLKSNAGLLGIKGRLAAPIPYIAPFIEAGVGMSVGSFETFTAYTAVKKSGLLMHIPFSLGLAIGRKHNFEIKYTYYYHDSARQFSGAAALGFTFPLNEY
jgi:hypothetical protein